MKLELKPRLNQLGQLSDPDLHAFRVEVAEAMAEVPNDPGNVSPIGQLGALQVANDLIARELDKRDVALAASAAPEPRRRGKVARMAARQGRAKPSPELAQDTGRAVLTAAAEMPGISPGQPITDRQLFAEGVYNVIRRLTKPGERSADTLVACARWEYPEDRRLGPDQERNARLIDAVCSPDSLVATGGICSPVTSTTAWRPGRRLTGRSGTVLPNSRSPAAASLSAAARRRRAERGGRRVDRGDRP